MKRIKNIILISLILSTLTCASSNEPSSNDGGENSKDYAYGAIAGALAGAAVGAITGDFSDAAIGSVVGAALGAASVAIYKNHIANRKLDFENRKEYLKACTDSVETVNKKTKMYFFLSSFHIQKKCLL